MSTTKRIAPPFTEKELIALSNLLDSIEAMAGGFDEDLERTIEEGLKAFDKSINRVGYYREDGALFKSK